jgi:hypothetical protein
MIQCVLCMCATDAIAYSSDNDSERQKPRTGKTHTHEGRTSQLPSTINTVVYTCLHGVA